MASRNLEILSKIIFIYSLFFIGLKIFTVLQGGWLAANLILALPFALLALWGGFLLKNKSYSWVYGIVGVVITILVRVYERDLVIGLHSYFNS